MLLFNNVGLQYPNKSTMMDMSTKPEFKNSDLCSTWKYSFSPFPSCQPLLKKYWESNRLKMSIVDIISSCNMKDFNIAKYENLCFRMSETEFAKYKAELEEYGEYDEDEYDTRPAVRYEDVHPSRLERYIEQILYAGRSYKNGLTTWNYNNEQTLDPIKMVDDDGEETIVSPSDLELSEQIFNPEEYDEAIRKLGYCIKKLHSGSIEYQFSILSVIIWAAKFRAANIRAFCKTKKYSDLFNDACDVAPMIMMSNDKGWAPRPASFGETDRQSVSTKNAVAWMTGCFNEIRSSSSNYISDPYWNYAEEFISACSVLDIDLAEEDANFLDTDLVSNAIVTSYFESNEEYIRNAGKSNSKLRCILASNKLFESVDSQLNADSDSSGLLNSGDAYKLECLANNSVMIAYEYGEEFKSDYGAIGVFFKKYNNYVREHNLGPEIFINDLAVDPVGYFTGPNGIPITIKLDQHLCCLGNRRFYGNLSAIVSIKGYMVLVTDDTEVFYFQRLRNTMRYFDRGDRDDTTWSEFSILSTGYQSS